MLKTAELILIPNAYTLFPLKLEQFRLRAYENMVAVALTNHTLSNNGYSVAHDPIASAGGGPQHAGNRSG